MIKDAVPNIPFYSVLPDDKVCYRQFGCPRAGRVLIRVARDRNPKSIINRILKFLLASDVSLGCLNRSVSEQKLNLFEFAAAIMAEAGTGATKIVRCQIGYAGLPGAPLDRIPDHVGCHAGVSSLSVFRNPSEHFPLDHLRMPKPGVEKLFAPCVNTD
jgi:hypothetical protein